MRRAGRLFVSSEQRIEKGKHPCEIFAGTDFVMRAMMYWRYEHFSERSEIPGDIGMNQRNVEKQNRARREDHFG